MEEIQLEIGKKTKASIFNAALRFVAEQRATMTTKVNRGIPIMGYVGYNVPLYQSVISTTAAFPKQDKAKINKTAMKLFKRSDVIILCIVMHDGEITKDFNWASNLEIAYFPVTYTKKKSGKVKNFQLDIDDMLLVDSTLKTCFEYMMK